MQRIQTEPRRGWQRAVEALGFGFHSSEMPYWDESAYYSFTLDEVDKIERASAELWALCLEAVQRVIDQKRYAEFAIPEFIIPCIEQSWEDDHPSIYARFDLCYRDGQIKLLEFNADTPTSLYEAGLVQWYWLQDFDKSKDQFNSIHEKLVEYWKYLKSYLRPPVDKDPYAPVLHFACLKESLEDLTNTEYLRDCAIQAWIDTKLVFIDDIGWDGKQFVDLENEPITNIFKLYPWEWLVADEFGKRIISDANGAYWMEPAWKMILSNKAILPLLWEMNPGHPLLLPAYREPGSMRNYIRKPILSREGANISIVREGQPAEHTEGNYGKEGFIYQQLFELPSFEGKHPVIGSWIIGQQPAGIGIREADGLITDNRSRFVPHLIQTR
ncbi:MAG: glutathionylspermidine synthase family protein [Chitinophagaceae bacterium]|nr:MAG: glutathionylspermidine synthase family protein [Chitinophagaceae bacterium]